MDKLITGLRGAAESTRLRLLSLCSQAELSVSELVEILEQSQPRISRHLKTLIEADLLTRHQEGSWVFYRIFDRGPMAGFLTALIAQLPLEREPIAGDRQRLDQILIRRRQAAEHYFAENAEQWDNIRSLYVDEIEVEANLRMLLPAIVVDHLDIGTGTGRILTALADRVRHGIGFDLSRPMLAVARANLQRADLTHCQVRLGNMYRLPLPDGSADLVTLHQVLHYADQPSAVIAEAARLVRPGGRVLVVDFAPHALETLRVQHAHRRLGFSEESIMGWCVDSGLIPIEIKHLPGIPLTVTLWAADRPQVTVSTHKTVVEQSAQHSTKKAESLPLWPGTLS